jgi:hypothetical protein
LSGLEVAVFLVYLQVAFLLPPFLLVSRATRWALTPRATTAGGDETQRILRMLDAIFEVWPTRISCLQRALTVVFALRRRGYGADLRIGVRKIGSNLQAHAWVELDGVVCGEPLSGEFPALEGAGSTVPANLGTLAAQE